MGIKCTTFLKKVLKRTCKLDCRVIKYFFFVPIRPETQEYGKSTDLMYFSIAPILTTFKFIRPNEKQLAFLDYTRFSKFLFLFTKTPFTSY